MVQLFILLPPSRRSGRSVSTVDFASIVKMNSKAFSDLSRGDFCASWGSSATVLSGASGCVNHKSCVHF